MQVMCRRCGEPMVDEPGGVSVHENAVCGTQATRRGDVLTAARKMGADAGTAAGSWAVDGNTSVDHARRVLAMLDSGDPEGWDYLPAMPTLSGEADVDPTPRSLADDLGIDAQEDGDLLSDACDAWEEAADAAFIAECERLLRAHVAI
jgi:hypothetical protein